MICFIRHKVTQNFIKNLKNLLIRREFALKRQRNTENIIFTAEKCSKNKRME